MRTFEESMAELAASIQTLARTAQQPGAFAIGDIQAAGQGRLRILCGGLQLEPEDLWLATGLDYKWSIDTGADNLLRPGDRVVLLSLDGQDYYLMGKAVKA